MGNTMTQSGGPGAIGFEDWYGVNCLLQSCADMLDRHDFAGHSQNFTADALFDDFPGDEHHGRAQIEEKIRKILTPYRTQHFVGTPIVTRADANTLNSLVYFMSTHQPADTKIIIKVYARYVDEIVKDEASGRLLISKRKVIRHLAENLTGFTSYWLPHLDNSPPDPGAPPKL